MKKLSALVALSLCAAAATTSAQAQTCAAAVTIVSNSTFTSDTSGTTNWMTSFGPLVSPSNDMLYTFVAGAQPLGSITPTSSTYQFAAYLIPSCSDTGTEPSPIKATSTVGTGIDLSTGITAGSTYYMAVTGIAAGGAGANGQTVFNAGIVPVTLQSFEVN